MSKTTAFKWGGWLMTACFTILGAVFPKYLPDKIAIGICVVAVIGAVAGIGLWLHGRKLGKKEEREREAKSLVIRERSNEIDDILDTVEAMDNYLYESLPKAERRILRKADCEKIFSVGNTIRVFFWFFTNRRHAHERVSEFMDEEKAGLEQYTKDDVYGNLDNKLNQLLRLKPISFRNEVYKFINLFYGFYSVLLYFSILKSLNTLPLPATMAIRRMNKVRKQGMGNHLTRLALKLGEYTENERDTKTL
jgi:hypothetical protein